MLHALLLILASLVTYFIVVRRRLIRIMTEQELLPAHTLLPSSAAGVEKWLRERDALAAPIQPGCESSVTWANGPSNKTGICVIFLHGWCASPPELDPVDKHIATALGANLLRYRYTGHGLRPMERGGEVMLKEQGHEQMRRDAAIAYALGRQLGGAIVLMGSSTGGSLAIWLSGQAWVRNGSLAALVLVSPGIRLAMPRATWLCVGWLLMLLPRAGSRSLLHAINGGKYKRPQMHLLPGARGEAQARCWTRVYPFEAVIHIIALYLICGASAVFESIDAPVLAFANPRDKTVSFAAAREAVHRMPQGQLEVVEDSENVHVITGRIASPNTVERIVHVAVEFLERHVAAASSRHRDRVGARRTRSPRKSKAKGS